VGYKGSRYFIFLDMSEEQLKVFLEAVKADAGLQEKLTAAADADAVVAIAKEVGFMISTDELQRAQVVGEELSDEELGDVAGGWGIGPSPKPGSMADLSNCPIVIPGV
jgi:predicted ribosomally synthesized peptide with nif11-like leader